MKGFILTLTILCFGITYAQKEGQDFCKGLSNGAYFPLDIKNKKLLWSDTFYFETFEKDTVIGGNKYLKFKQVWEKGNNDVLFFREKTGVVFQYFPENNKEIVRIDPSFKPGDTWKNELQDCVFTLIGYDEKLETPYCQYNGLLAIKAVYPKVTYVFYYQKGYGYVGATKNGKTLSAASPE
ncbi:hypothetical protein HYN59_16980 [Flavobacterium album]|uniref:Uncharacterized protein n=1 Tax=Flavobacterium album TaxID=2175091 RepID=A0A2S1R231_9FLAO|nr:hypothetical protein [Flavobacterium album]AWH86695.1 hypothetical protein HYN59_16980 [Flavobacterium album]